MSVILFENAKLLDPTQADLQDGVAVLVEGDRIREVSPRPIRTSGATVVDVAGRTLMPGLIDCHVHVFLPEVNIRALEAVPLTLLTARAAPLMRAMLDRGLTTVRDTGGAGEALSPQEIIHSATIVGAELLGRPGELGVIAPGALADLLVVDGNPLADLGAFQDQGAHIPVVMQGGRFHRNRLGAG